MAKTQQNATMWQGETKSLVFTISGTTVTTATAIVWELSKTVSSANLVTKTLAAGTITADSATQCTVALTASDTNSINGKHYHELRITDASSNTTVVASGYLQIEISTTKS